MTSHSDHPALVPDHPDMPAVLGGMPTFPAGAPGWPLQDDAIREVLLDAWEDGSWGRYHGPHCDRLINALSKMHDGADVLLCSSGTVAMELALRGFKVGSGDEVILAAYDFKANFQNILTLGATPVLVDVEARNWQIDPSQIEAAITEKTRAIIVSHLHGGMVDMQAVREIAEQADVPVIEDACQMHGAMVRGRTAGLWGDVGVLSFGGSKLLSAGRGGALLTHRDDVLQRIRLYTHRGNDASPLSEIQAALLLPQLARLAERNAVRSENVERLTSQLKDRVAGLIPFHCDLSNSQPAFYKLGFRFQPDEFAGLTRDQFSCAIQAEGVALQPGFRALHAIHSQRRFRAIGELPHATEADVNILTLHHPVLLGSENDMRQVVAAIWKIQIHAERIAAYVSG